MELKNIKTIFALLLMVGIIFGTFEALPDGLGFDWFVKMLWFVIGFPVLVILAVLIFTAGIKGEEAIAKA